MVYTIYMYSNSYNGRLVKSRILWSIEWMAWKFLMTMDDP